MSKINVNAILAPYGITTAKSLGQNFLNDTEILEQIAAAAQPEGKQGILEIGAGIGSLTELLCREAEQVVTVEIDQRLEPLLQKQVPDQNHLFLWQDVLKTDWLDVQAQYFNNQPYTVVGNLPYYITTEILMVLLRNLCCWNCAVLMVQKEVAHRLLAGPGSKEYRAVSVLIQCFCEAELLFEVPPHYFYPAPHVTSAVIRLKPRSDRPKDPEKFIQLAESGFAARRKVFASSPAAQQVLKRDREGIRSLLRQAGLDENARAEAYSPADFKKLYEIAQI